MKMKTGFIQRRVAGEYVIIPTGAENIAEFNGLITMNETSAFLCELLKEEQTREQLLTALLERYEVEKERAEADLDQLLSVMSSRHMLEV